MTDTIELFPGVTFRKDMTKPLGNQWMFFHEGSWLIAKLAYCDDISMDHLAKVTRERDDLAEQVRIFHLQGRTITLSGCDFTENELLGAAVRAVRGSRRNTLPRWALVRDAFCTGSGVGTALCRRFNLDPDEVLKN